MFGGMCAIVVALVSLIPVVADGRSGLDSAFGPSNDIWIERTELRSLPMSGEAWEDLERDATGHWGEPDIADQDSRHDTHTFAGALYAVRRNDVGMRRRVVSAIESAIGTERGGRTLALARNLTGYVLAADLIGYRTSGFTDWLSEVRHDVLPNGDTRYTLVTTHEIRPNNWGTHAGAARMATALYLEDQTDLDRAVQVFRGYLGDRSAYTGFRFGDPEWQAVPSAPVAINPAGSRKNGVLVDGAIVDDIRRCECEVTYPPPKEKYQWEAMQGIVTQATLLAQAGHHDVWLWSDAAIRRAVVFLYLHADYPADGDNNFLTYLIDRGLGLSTSTGVDARTGQSIGYTDWTHATRTATDANGPASVRSKAVRIPTDTP